ncbi:hypothetical protein EYR40_001003 [Pleurotus pulmonarius]|nr:hypothetical protein EYR38_004247 [Pleurotus pulmonarius]KAF4608657.1 hypothetical protein EYR40_001003 [Pleurotus pulmonarius]
MNPVTCKDWDINSIVSDNSNFFHLRRVSASSPDVDAHIQQFEEDGIPLIIEGFHRGEWPDVFDAEWLRSHGPQTLSVRNVHTRSDSILPIDEFFKISREASPYAAPNETARLYGKDVECPAEWNYWLHNAQVIPNKLLPKSSDNMLMNLPRSTPVETLMCYIGIGDTYTPAHKDLCASSGQNLMCYTEKDGSSIWFMTESSNTPEVDAFFRKLGNEIDHETQVLSVEDLAKAPFNVYVTRQRLGDLVLVPPRSCHQVINSGGISIKMSWSRMTIRGLMTAYYHELPLYRRVCRPEIYKIKSIVFYTLLRRASQLRVFCEGTQGNGAAIAADLARVVGLFASILVEEYSGPAAQFDPMTPLAESSELSSFDPQRYEPKDGCLVCDFCGADIFQTYFESEICCADSPDTSQTSKPDPFVLCSGCYAEGRSCQCQRMTLLQCYSFNDLCKELQDAIIVLGTYQTKNQLKIDAQGFDFQKDFEGAHHGLIQAEKSGERPELHHQLAHLALIHRTCKPLSTSIVPGWYDHNIESTPISAVSMALTDAVHPQPSLKTSMAPEARLSTAFDIDDLSDTSTLTPASSPTSSPPPPETKPRSVQTPASAPAPPKTTQHSMQIPLSTPPIKYSAQDMRHIENDFIGVCLPAPPERSRTRSLGRRNKVPSKTSCSPSIMLEGQRVARVSLKSHIPADSSAGPNARVMPTRKRPHEDGDGGPNHSSTSAGRSKLARTYEETSRIRKPRPSEQSEFSSSLAHSLQASFETTSVEDEAVDEAVYGSPPPPKRSRKSRAVAQPAHKSRAPPVEVHVVVDDELQEDLSVDLPTVGTEEPTVITPELAPPAVFPTQGDILRAAAFVTVQLLWNVSGIAQAMDDSSKSPPPGPRLLTPPTNALILISIVIGECFVLLEHSMWETSYTALMIRAPHAHREGHTLEMGIMGAIVVVYHLLITNHSDTDLEVGKLTSSGARIFTVGTRTIGKGTIITDTDATTIRIGTTTIHIGTTIVIVDTMLTNTDATTISADTETTNIGKATTSAIPSLDTMFTVTQATNLIGAGVPRYTEIIRACTRISWPASAQKRTYETLKK